MSDSFSNIGQIFQIQLSKFVAIPMCTPLCKFFIIINADLHRKVFIINKLVNKEIKKPFTKPDVYRFKVQIMNSYYTNLNLSVFMCTLFICVVAT